MALTSEFAGWGRAITSRAELFSPEEISTLASFVTSINQRGALPIGLHRSYGDSALNSGGQLISLASFKNCTLHLDSGFATIGAGLTIRELESITLPHGYLPPVVPGTGFVTIGGAIAADIHGKSHHLTGSFGSQVRRMRILLSSGETIELFPAGESAEFFWATVGGLGLTGVILEADINLVHIGGNSVEVDEVRAKDLDQVMSELVAADRTFAHTVAWLDLSGKYLGRGRVGKANYCDKKLATKKAAGSASLTFPKVLEHNFINQYSVRAFNELWFRKPLDSGIASISNYMHPLDGVQSWNRIYGKAGFIQYQFVIPNGKEELLVEFLERAKKIRAASFLTVLKRFGEASHAPLSFPIQGWTLAVDFPVGIPGLGAMLADFDQRVASAGGRIYLVKDARVAPELVEVMYPQLSHWQSVRERMDPIHTWKSDQSRRLTLC
jgi:decaprenylphospho-beta-D-ribofuranose 2-oxidase